MVFGKVNWIKIAGDFHGVVIILLHTLCSSRHLQLHVTATVMASIIVRIITLIFKAIALEFNMSLVL